MRVEKEIVEREQRRCARGERDSRERERDSRKERDSRERERDSREGLQVEKEITMRERVEKECE